MKNKLKFGVLAAVMGIAMSCQTFAVVYEPNLGVDINVDRTEALDGEDVVNKILDLYNSGNILTDEELAEYDLDHNGIVDANDAAVALDSINN